MYKRWENALRGHVRLTVECAMPERVINLCGAHEIPFWDVQVEDAIRFSLSTTRAGARKLRELSGRVPAQITAGRERGAPALLEHLRRRYVLIAALVLFLAGAWYAGNYVWTFSVTGNETVPTATILRALEKQGIRPGIRATAVDQDVLRNHILLELPELSWLAVNVRGCTAHVQVVERHRPGTLVQDDDYTSVVAARPAVVTGVQTLRGQRLVQPGDTVETGQILISGAVQSASGGVNYVHAMGDITGRTHYVYTMSVPLHYVKKTAVEAQRWCCWLDVGKKRIKIAGRGSKVPENCDRITVYKNLSLPFGVKLPLTWVEQKTVRYVLSDFTRSEETAEKIGRRRLLAELAAALPEGAEIVHTAFSGCREGDCYVITLAADCDEPIGKTVPIP